MQTHEWPESWDVATQVTIGTMHFTLYPPTYFRAVGEQRVYRFTHHVTDRRTGQEWIDGMIGSWDTSLEFRSFSVMTVIEVVPGT